MPPTAGLPAKITDFLPPWRLRGAQQKLTEFLAAQFSLPPLQLECSGTACLIIALETLKAMPQNKNRDEVVIPAYNCPLVPMAIARCGLKIRLCDTAPDSFDFDPKALAACVNDKTLALVPAHLGGQAADIAACAPLARRHGAYIIEDAAQAFGAPKAAGIGRRGDICFFSLAAGKGLTLYEGGLLTAKTAAMRAALAATSRRIVPSRFWFEARRMAEFFAYACFYRPWGLNFVYGAPRRRALKQSAWAKAAGDVFSFDIPLHRVSAWRAACGLRAARRLPQFLRQTEAQAAARLLKLRALAEQCRDASGSAKLRLIGAGAADKALWPFFMLLCADKADCARIMRRLWPSPHGVSRLFAGALADYAYLQPLLGKQDPAPNARSFAARMFTVSNSLWLANSRFEKLCHIIKQAFKQKGRTA